jgi:hypothetical protein
MNQRELGDYSVEKTLRNLYRYISYPENWTREDSSGGVSFSVPVVEDDNEDVEDDTDDDISFSLTTEEIYMLHLNQ